MYSREDDGVARKQPSQGQTDWPFPDGTEGGMTFLERDLVSEESVKAKGGPV